MVAEKTALIIDRQRFDQPWRQLQRRRQKVEYIRWQIGLRRTDGNQDDGQEPEDRFHCGSPPVEIPSDSAVCSTPLAFTIPALGSLAATDETSISGNDV